jgi:hypothetical protein
MAVALEGSSAETQLVVKDHAAEEAVPRLLLPPTAQ